MKRAGLVCAGGVAQSFVARMPALIASIGPVKAASLRVARRIANALRCGDAVDDWAPFESCDAIWIAAPESALDAIAAELPRGIPAIMCGTPRARSSFAIECAATVYAIPPTERALAAEGDARALRYLRQACAADHRRLVKILPSAKPLFFAGMNLAAHLTLPWIAAAVESLRAAGFSRVEATQVVEQLGGRALRSYRKAGAKAWNAAAENELRRALSAALPDARFANLYRAGIEQALEFFSD